MTPIKLGALTLYLALALGFAGCGEEAQEALLSYTFFEEEPSFSRDLLVIEFTDGGRTRRLTGSDFVAASSLRSDTREFETRTSGELVTEFWLISGADTLSSGELSLQLRPDFRWNISFQRADADPTDMCFGCIGSVAVELASSLQQVPADSLWVVWGGNSISNPVVF